MFKNLLKKIDGMGNSRLSNKNHAIRNNVNLIVKDVEELSRSMTNSDKYLDFNFETEYKRKYRDLLNYVNKSYSDINIMDTLFSKYVVEEDVKKNLHGKMDYLKKLDIKSERIRLNKSYVKNKMIELKDYFSDIEGKSLDNSQREAIIKDELNNLVVASAGSGKTTTIVGKVKYLIEKCGFSQEDLLILSFTNKSANEMQERILKNSNYNIDVMTFHKLGLGIIESTEHKKPNISKVVLEKYSKEILKELMKDSSYLKKFNTFFVEYLSEYKSQFEFETLGEYINFLSNRKLQTLKKEKLKSMEEIEIANFLYMNNIEYEYEKQYKMISERYLPDFYLSDYDIYLEHFGINRSGNVPKFFTGKNSKSPRETYQEGMKWKRELHKQYNTKLIETYSYEKMEGELLTNLSKTLIMNGVKLKQKSSGEVFDLIKKENTEELNVFIRLLTGFINYMRQNNISFESLRNNIKDIKEKNKSSRISLFIELTQPVLESYIKYLKERDEIDFSDMINKAIEYTRDGSFKSTYKYIIIDEYQDISLNRLNLIKSLKNQTNGKVFCVGDDWQSIYKFAGSEVSLFTDFAKYMGFTEISKIEMTYRFNQRIVKLSSEFVQKNNFQIKKNVQSFLNSNVSQGENCATIDKLDIGQSVHIEYGYNDNELKGKLYDILYKLPKNSKVVLLGRYNFDIDKYLSSKIRITREKYISFVDRSDLDIEFLTVHASKGLEGDYVILLNCRNGKLGFPSNIEDDSIYDILRRDYDKFQYAEERRLFYVALTRTKKEIWMLVNSFEKSVFIEEIENDYFINNKLDNRILCPVCNNEMVLRTGKYGVFYGCSNYPYCDKTLSSKPIAL